MLIVRKLIDEIINKNKDLKSSLFVFVISMNCYFYMLSHYSMAFDDVSFHYYYDEKWILAQGRFTSYVLEKIFNLYDIRPFLSQFLGLVCLIVAGYIFVLVLEKKIGKKFSGIQTGMLVSSLVSFPIIAEIFGYEQVALTIGFGYLLTFVSLYVFIEYEEVNIQKGIIISSLIMLFAVASFESFASVFLSTVMIVLFFSKKNIFKEGIPYAIVLIVASVLKVIINIIFRIITGINGSGGASNGSYWLHTPFSEWGIRFKQMMLDNFELYVFNALDNPFITIIVLCYLLLIIYCVYLLIKKEFKKVLCVCVILISPFIISFMQGAYLKYRAGQSFVILEMFLIILSSLYFNKYRIINYLIIFVVLINQSVFLNDVFYYDYLRHEDETKMIANINHDLEKMDLGDKDIYLIGNYKYPKQLNDFVYRSASSLSCMVSEKLSNVEYFESYSNRCIGSNRFHSSNMSIINGYMFYLPSELDMIFYVNNSDYKIKIMPVEEYELYSNQPKYPKEGYITEYEDKIIIKLN